MFARLCLYVSPYVRLSVRPPASQPARQQANQSVGRSVAQPASQSARQLVCLSVCLSACRSLIVSFVILTGELAIVNITISDPTKVEKSSLTIDIIDTSGKTLISNKKLISVGKSGSRFSFSFRPPNKPFKLMLKGKTTGNSIFQRISRHVGDAKPLVLKEFYNSGRNKIKQGGSATIILYLFNSSNRDQRFEIVFKDTLGYQVSLPGRQTRKVRAKRRKFIRVSVRYSGGKLGRVGQTENVIIIVKAKDCVTTEVVSLMIAK